MMKFAMDRVLASPGGAAHKLVEIASGIEPVQDGRIYIELVNAPFLWIGGTGDRFRAGIALACERDRLELLESGTYVRLTRNAGKAPSFERDE